MSLRCAQAPVSNHAGLSDHLDLSAKAGRYCRASLLHIVWPALLASIAVGLNVRVAGATATEGLRFHPPRGLVYFEAGGRRGTGFVVPTTRGARVISDCRLLSHLVPGESIPMRLWVDFGAKSPLPRRKMVEISARLEGWALGAGVAVLRPHEDLPRNMQQHIADIQLGVPVQRPKIVAHWAANHLTSIWRPAKLGAWRFCSADSDLHDGQAYSGGPVTDPAGDFIGMTRVALGEAWVESRAVVLHVANRIAEGAADKHGRLAAGFFGWTFDESEDGGAPRMSYQLALAPAATLSLRGWRFGEAWLDAAWRPVDASFLEDGAELLTQPNATLRLRARRAGDGAHREVSVSAEVSRDLVGAVYLARLGLDVQAQQLDDRIRTAIEMESTWANAGQTALLDAEQWRVLPRGSALRVMAPSSAFASLERDSWLLGLRLTLREFEEPMVFPLLTEALGLHEPGLGLLLLADPARPVDFIVGRPTGELALRGTSQAELEDFIQGVAALNYSPQSVDFFRAAMH